MRPAAKMEIRPCHKFQHQVFTWSFSFYLSTLL